jgi:hypothetical protein
MRRGRVDEAIRQFLSEQNAHVVTRLLKPRFARALSTAAERGIREELDRLQCEDPARALFLFLMFNDQRRHWASTFEDIDLDRVECLTPFYDSDFLVSVMRWPLDLCLGHKFYTKWISCFPSLYSSVPWQTYPGHEPCPLPIPASLRSQWDAPTVAGVENRRAATSLRVARALLAAPDFPTSILRKGVLRLATLIHRTGLRNYSYLIGAAETYHRYWTACAGKYVLPPDC